MKNVFKGLTGLVAAALLVIGMSACSQDSDSSSSGGSSGNNGSSTSGNSSGTSQVATPSFSISSGEVTSGTSVTISCATDGAEIYYTTTGDNPTTASTKYSDALSITSAVTIKAIAVKSGMTNSAVATSSYTIKSSGNSGSTNAVAGKSYYGPTIYTAEYTDGNKNKVETGVYKISFDSTGTAVHFTNMQFNYENGTVKTENTVETYNLTYSISGSTITVTSGNNSMIFTINEDGTLTSSGSTYKKYTGDIYAGTIAATTDHDIYGYMYIFNIKDSSSYAYDCSFFKNASSDSSEKTVTSESGTGTYSGNSFTSGDKTCTFGTDTLTMTKEDGTTVVVMKKL